MYKKKTVINLTPKLELREFLPEYSGHVTDDGAPQTLLCSLGRGREVKLASLCSAVPARVAVNLVCITQLLGL